MKNKNIKRIAAGSLAFALALTSAGVLPVQAAEESTEKEEVVYGMLDANGNVSGIYVVNIFSGATEIVDYGDYTDVKNLTTTDPVSFENGVVSIETDADKLYYQGNLDTTDLPWNIAIHYFMDGTEYSPEEIAGLSGALKITIEVTQNANCDESFWEGYALQAKLSLDSSMAQNLVADGATIANVGSDKQLSYIILPGHEKELEISADVTDFEMDAIEINGVKLNLSIDFDDSELMEKVGEIQNAAGDLNDGASSLNDGMVSLNSGISQINSGLIQLNENSDDLTNGSAEVLTALKTIQASLANVNLDVKSLNDLATASTQIKGGIDSLVSGLQTVDGSIDGYYYTLNQAGITDVSAFAVQNAQAAQTLSAMNTSGQYDSVIALLQADSAYITGSDALISGISGSLDSSNGSLMTGALALQTNYAAFDTTIQSMVVSLGSLSENMALLKSGIDTLVANYTVLDDGINDYTGAVAEIVAGYEQIYSGSGTLATATNTLYDGTTAFYDATSDIDTEISDAIDEKISDLTGSDVETISFVSDKNTRVDSVLFVMKTTAIEKEAVEETSESTESSTGFFQKFFALFKKD